MPADTLIDRWIARRATSAYELCQQHQLWTEQRAPTTGFLAALLGPKRPASAKYDHLAGGLLAAIVALLDGKGDQPEGTADNVAALAAFPSLGLVVELLELRLPKAKRPVEYTLPELLATAHFPSTPHTVDGKLVLGYAGTPRAHELRGLSASLQEFFTPRPPSPASVELIAAYMQRFQQLLFVAPLPGDLWLKTPASQRPVRALPAGIFRYNNCYSDNKVVLGGAGSGRSVMMGRLCQAAHEKGNQVVMIAYRQQQGPMHHFTRNQGGAMRQITTRSEAAFNPFYFPERFTSTNKDVIEPLVIYLSQLLDCLLQTATPQLPRLRNGVLYSLLAAYFQQQPWRASGANPSFDSFYEFVSSAPAQGWAVGQVKPCPTCGAEAGCQQPKSDPQLAIFLEAGEPFYGTGELAYLMNAQPEQASALFATQNRLLYINLAVGYLGDELRDEVATQCISWLLLFGIDMHIGLFSPGQHHNRQDVLTVAVDELFDECLTSVSTTFVAPYLRSKRQNAQELLCSWHNSPQQVFCAEHPVATLIRDSAGCFVLLSSGPTWHKHQGLWLSDEQQAQYQGMQRNQLLIAGLREFDGVYDATMNQQELSVFEQSPE